MSSNTASTFGINTTEPWLIQAGTKIQVDQEVSEFFMQNLHISRRKRAANPFVAIRYQGTHDTGPSSAGLVLACPLPQQSTDGSLCNGHIPGMHYVALAPPLRIRTDTFALQAAGGHVPGSTDSDFVGVSYDARKDWWKVRLRDPALGKQIHYGTCAPAPTHARHPSIFESFYHSYVGAMLPHDGNCCVHRWAQKPERRRGSRHSDASAANANPLLIGPKTRSVQTLPQVH
jgi:hypothetical protein